jgi:hypothetical protein
MEGRDPLRAVLAPQQNPVALPNTSPRQERRKSPRLARQLPIGRNTPPVALVANHCDLSPKAAKVVNQCSQVVSHERSGKFMVSDAGASDSVWM